MLLSIIHPTLTDSDIALLNALCVSDTSTVVVCSGDGVYALQLNTEIFRNLQGCVSIYAVKQDTVLRGVKVDQHITHITDQEFAALAASSKQWVTL